MSTGKNRQPLLLQIITLFFWFAIYVYIPYQTPYLTSIGVAASVAGLVVGASGFLQIIVRPPIGLIADRWAKNKQFIITGVSAVGIASAVRFAFPNEVGYLVGSLLTGLAISMWMAFLTMYSNMFDRSGTQKALGRIINMGNSGMLLGFIAGMLLSDATSIHFLNILSVAGAVIALVLALFLKEPKPEFKKLPIKEHFKVYKDKRIVVFGLLLLVQQGMIGATSTGFTAQVAKNLGATGFEIGLATMIFMVVGVLTTMFGNTRVALKWGPPFWVPVTMLGLVAYCVIIPNVPSLEWIYLAEVLSGIGQGILQAYCVAEGVKNVPGHMRSTALGLMQAIYSVGATMLPIILGWVADAAGMDMGFYAMAALSAAATVLALVFYIVTGKKGKNAELSA